MTDIQLILVDPNTALCLAFQRAFSDLQKVEILNGYFEQAPDFDCLVSPANSFGLMDGGVDAAIIKFFEAELQSKVQKHILEVYLGEQPVGSCFILETGNSKHPYLANTPTIRVPMEISRTDNIYRAM